MPNHLILVNPLKFSVDELDAIEKLASLGYSRKQMAMYLEVSFKEFKKACETEGSEIDYRIKKGKLEADYLINEKLLESAKGGNITSGQEYRKAQAKIELEQFKSKMLYGED
jgi:hypothetical protein